ncbi:Shedu immune nuclease family protein [Stenotrophomonas sp. Ker107b]
MASSHPLKTRREGATFAGMVGLSFSLDSQDGQPMLTVSAAPSALALSANTAIEPRNVVIARIDDSRLRTYPINVNPYKPDFMEPKYGTLREITVTDMWFNFDHVSDLESFSWLLSDLPPGFNTQGDLGLGFVYAYRAIAEQIAAIEGVERLLLTPGRAARISDGSYHLGRTRYDEVRRDLNRIAAHWRAHAQSQRMRHAHNALLNAASPERFAEQPDVLPSGTLRRVVATEEQVSRMPKADQKALVVAATSTLKVIAEESLPTVLKLGQTLQRVALEQLIERFEGALAKKHSEATWQSFFSANSFVLGLAFAYPALVVSQQTHVGYTNSKGAGHSILDFLIANASSGNVAIVEIKTPEEPLLEARAYRGKLKGPHGKLTSAVGQVLHQRIELVSSFVTKQHEQALRGKDVASVHCILIAGTTPQSRQDRRSLEIFRGALRDVSIVTFDELLGKLKIIASVLEQAEDALG